MKALTTTQKNEVSAKQKSTIKAIIEQGTAENTIKAYRSDLAYIAAWYTCKFGNKMQLPLTVDETIGFITDHIADMDNALEAALVNDGVKVRGRHSLNTIKRRMASLSVAHKSQGVANPCHDPQIKMLLSKAQKAAIKNGYRVNKKTALAKDSLDRLVATCKDSLLDKRDKALLLVAFASGGRRRSEVVDLRFEDLHKTVTDYTITG